MKLSGLTVFIQSTSLSWGLEFKHLVSNLLHAGWSAVYPPGNCCLLTYYKGQSAWCANYVTENGAGFSFLNMSWLLDSASYHHKLHLSHLIAIIFLIIVPFFLVLCPLCVWYIILGELYSHVVAAAPTPSDSCRFPPMPLLKVSVIWCSCHESVVLLGLILCRQFLSCIVN